MTLEMIVSTATVNGQDGTLQELISRHVAGIRDLPQGADTVLTWDDSDSDEETHELRARAKSAFQTALAETGRSIPTTVAELASLLAELGVYQHTSQPNGVHRWRAGEDLPNVGDVLPLPSEWIEQEDHVQWRTVTAYPACELSDHLRAHGRPARLDTSIERLATDCAQPPEWVRDALDGMVYRGWLVVLRHDLSANRSDIHRFPEHARITLVLDWAVLDHSNDEKTDDETDDEEIDLSTIRWSSSPWATYRNISQDPRISKDTLKVLSNLPFRIKKSNGSGASLPCLDEIAASQAMSINTTIDALHRLEQAGIVWWDADHQRMVIAGPDGPVGDNISKAIQQASGQV
jgi:hypothetical protein